LPAGRDAVRSPFSYLHRQSLRVRITLSFVATAAALTLILSLATFFAVQTILRNQRVHSSTRQTVFALLFAREFLADQPDRSQQLVSRLQSREHFDAMVVESDHWFSTSLALTPRSVPVGLRGLVGQEKAGYQYSGSEIGPVLIFGAPLPPQHTDLYLFYPLNDVDRTMSLLARVLTVSALAVMLFAALLAQRMSRRILRPLAGVSKAAHQVAEGLLETRVTPTSSDEVGMLAASFNQMAGALQDMIQRERRFVAAVSHELRTPLAALAATGELLEARRDELPPPAREAADLVVEDVTNLRHLVQELMEVSELESQRATVRLEAVDLRTLAHAVVHKRRLAVPVVGPSVTTATDKARVERILANLVDNAFDHGEGREVRVEVRQANGECRVSVADHGPGIDPTDQAHLFERFYKADRSRSRERGGIGLGLAISMLNARLLGGTIEVMSEPGRGSVFTLSLPAQEAVE